MTLTAPAAVAESPALLVDNTLSGFPGRRPSNDTLVASARSGTVTITNPGRAFYDPARMLRGKPSMRLTSGPHRGATPRLHVPLPSEGPWYARWYVYHPATQDAGYGQDEVRWHVEVGGVGVLTFESNAGNLYGHLQPSDLAADSIRPTDVRGTPIPVSTGWLRLSIASSGGETAVGIYPGHEPTPVRALGWPQALSGGELVITGYRYRRRPTLYWGDQGPQVRDLQRELQDLGYDLGAAGVDGDFGDMTYYAVKAFQQDEGLSPQDGIPGPETRAAMDYRLGGAPPPLWVSHVAVSGQGWVGPEPEPIPEPEPVAPKLVTGMPV